MARADRSGSRCRSSGHSTPCFWDGVECADGWQIATRAQAALAIRVSTFAVMWPIHILRLALDTVLDSFVSRHRFANRKVLGMNPWRGLHGRIVGVWVCVCEMMHCNILSVIIPLVFASFFKQCPSWRPARWQLSQPPFSVSQLSGCASFFWLTAFMVISACNLWRRVTCARLLCEVPELFGRVLVS